LFSNPDKHTTFEVDSEQDFKDIGNALLSLAVYHTLHSLDIMVVKEQDAIYASCHGFLTKNIPYLGALKANRYHGMAAAIGLMPFWMAQTCVLSKDSRPFKKLAIPKEYAKPFLSAFSYKLGISKCGG
jgi:hypothetical protein